MRIIDNRENNEKLINNVLPGQVFIHYGKCYMKTDSDNFVVNLASGELIDCREWIKTYTLVIPVNAVLTME